MGNTDLLSKKQLGEIIPQIDTTKKGGAWQTELRHAKAYGNIEVVGRKYRVNEIYDTPKELVHGNTGRDPSNKGQFSENSLKYKLAKALILLFAKESITCNDFHPKSTYYTVANCKMNNLKHFDSMFFGTAWGDFEPIEIQVLKLANNTSKSLNGLFDEAIELIKKGVFEGIKLEEQIYFATFDYEHYEAEENDDCYEIIDLYNQADTEAKQIVEEEYGKSVFFSKRKTYINYERRELIDNDEKYQLLFDNKIDYIYTKYAIVGALQQEKAEFFYDYEAQDYDGTGIEQESDFEGEDLANEFMVEFRQHREESAKKKIKEFSQSAGTKGIINKNQLEPFAVDFLNLLFQYSDYHIFVDQYNELMNEVKKIVNTGFGFEEAETEITK